MTENAVLLGDCVEVMAGMEPESVDAIVTDPPYGLEFMGKEWDRVGRRTGHHLDPSMQITAAEPEKGNPWASERSGYGAPSKNWRCRKCNRLRFDHAPRRCACEKPDWDARTREYGLVMQSWHQRWAEAAYRVAKPSAYLLAFGGTRTVHRMTVALEDAGWIIRDMLVWAYASGFPKSKASLKPAWEPIVMARKPGPLRMLAIDECRIPHDAESKAWVEKWSGDGGHPITEGWGTRGSTFGGTPAGRWPANVLLTDPIFDGGVDGVVGGGEASYNPAGVFGVNRLEYESDAIYGNGKGIAEAGRGVFGYGDSGTYSRFFLIPKADRADREPVLGGLPLGPRESISRRGRCVVCERWAEPGEKVCQCGGAFERESNTPRLRANVHPTVKPTELMRHLVRLVTPTGGLVLDPFLGSGTTAIAAELEGFRWLGIEKEPEYVAIAEARLNGTQRGLGLAG